MRHQWPTHLRLSGLPEENMALAQEFTELATKFIQCSRVYSDLTEKVSKISKPKQEKKKEMDEVGKELAQKIITNTKNVWFDESGKGTGPFLCVKKKKTSPSLNKNLALEFFTGALPAILSKHIEWNSPEKVAQKLLQFMASKSTRSLTVSREIKSVPKYTLHQLKVWLETGTMG